MVLDGYISSECAYRFARSSFKRCATCFIYGSLVYFVKSSGGEQHVACRMGARVCCALDVHSSGCLLRIRCASYAEFQYFHRMGSLALLGLVLLFSLPFTEQQDTGPCDDAKLIEDDWRYPSEENKRKCDNRLRSGMWYKFKYQGQSAVVAQGPIKENHCSTSGPISVSLQSESHLYPPPRNQSALYKACVHVTVMDLVTCVDHLTIPLLVMTCPDNDVIYFVNKTIKDCPSAFCITGREESVDRYYLIDVPQEGKYYTATPRDHRSIEVHQLTPSQMDEVVTYSTSAQESFAREQELKQQIAKALNLKSWSNCVGNSVNKSASCHDYEKSVIRSSITFLGHIISEESNETSEGASLSITMQEEVRNASRMSYESSMLKFVGSLCQVQADDVKMIKLRPRTLNNETRNSLYVESFCGITRGSDLIRCLLWLNSTEILSSLIEADVLSIHRGFPPDQLPAVKVPEFCLNPSVWVLIFCCSLVVLSCLSSACFFFRIHCASNNHMKQKEKIFLIDCDGRSQWLSGPNKRQAPKDRNRRSTTSSREVFQRQTSSISARRQSVTSGSTLMSVLSTPTPTQFKKDLNIVEEETSKPRILIPPDRGSSEQIPVSSRKDDGGLMIPLREFLNSSTPVPRLVVDTKRRSLGSRSFRGARWARGDNDTDDKEEKEKEEEKGTD